MKLYSTQDIHRIVSDSSHTFVSFSKDVALIMGVPWDDKFKARVTQCLAPKGTSRPNQAEHEAMSLWCYCHDNIAQVALNQITLSRLSMKVKILSEWLSGKRQINWREARSMQKFLKSIKVSS